MKKELIYTKGWRFGWLVIYAGMSVMYFTTLTGNLQLILGGVFAVMTGYQICFATAMNDWRNLSNGWRDLYQMVSKREQRWSKLHEERN